MKSFAFTVDAGGNLRSAVPHHLQGASAAAPYPTSFSKLGLRAAWHQPTGGNSTRKILAVRNTPSGGWAVPPSVAM